MSSTVKNLLIVLNQIFPFDLASEWDSIGLIQGKKSQKVSSILLCVDITPEIFEEAHTLGVNAIVSHHPLFLEDEIPLEYKAKIMSLAERYEIALLNCHTNADAMTPGVSDALALALGVERLEVLEAREGSQFGIGRIGDVEVMSYDKFKEHVKSVLPTSVVRSTKEVSTTIQRVALCAGSGASLLPLVRATDADVYITSDVKHHAVSEHLAEGGCAVIDIDHGVSESMYLDGLKKSLSKVLDVEIFVSQLPFGMWVAQ